MREALDTVLVSPGAATRPRWLGSWELVTGTACIALAVLAALLAPWLAPYDPLAQDVGHRLLAPGAAHWLGTDGLGRGRDRHRRRLLRWLGRPGADGDLGRRHGVPAPHTRARPS